ncbi:MAG: putative phage tail protein [Serratia marcescens]|nr:putative phage tail protein [Serratia marcescens]
MGLIDKLPSFYKQSDSVIDIQGSLEKERCILEENIKKLINDLFVITSENIERWEKLVGIKSDVSKTLEFRKTNVIARIRGKGTTTIDLIKNVSISYSNGEVDVIEDNENYKFIVRFVGQKGIPTNLNDLKNAIEEIKPAHLEVEYQFIYNTWNMISHLTWNEANTSTWEGLRVR